MEIKDIKRVAELMKANDLTEFSLKDEDFELAMKRGNDEPQVVYAQAAPMAAAPAAAPAAASPAAALAEEDDGLIEIPSPIVGTFYRRPAPDAENFVEVGAEVTEDTVVCIVEAMKVMNEIKAEVRGVIKKILVDDTSPVQYGQPLFLVEPK
ncbi:acetyl-CoA carboxylase biotin carboxyl carrier protein [Pontiella sulfatireligans]|uniref:Biotin carboxyl carrier protein of acetyl-CoA carboxylase n=1 Tax=Pontiella sulfatireligans TaxID=2750658 RepID=A0A6C2UU11_9BACT|nr:acetyl-CoA carboxylase biotin carboxyl carrier protein [Pontiella sulfatireligans]VGO22724.1 Biotin carboxyl carrier protein of acetyl-CoA carboxylase [Pontiella sulfatireligans]